MQFNPVSSNFVLIDWFSEKPELHNNLNELKLKAMAAEIITKEDLQEFGKNLLNQIRGLLGQTIEEPKKWLKTYQVKNLLKISDNTLQTLRDNGTIPFTKIGGILYYNFDDINKVLSGEVKPKRIKVGKESKAA